MQELQVLIAADRTILSVPASLGAITTYVLLEQEGWFEKEVEFVRRYIQPGMTAIDIGANLGVYSLPMARQVGPAGAVYSFEPASSTRAHLSRSIELNQCSNLHLIPAAVSNRRGEAQLALQASSEMNKLSDEGTGERVALTSLDAEGSALGWKSPDFIKIDAEGEEIRIIEGGQRFFARHSPLVMFEVNADSNIERSLLRILEPLGYNTYRQLTGEPVLVPVDPDEPIDTFELNLFATKPDRAAQLAAAGLLVDRLPTWQPDEAARARAVPVIEHQAFAASTTLEFGITGSLDPMYRDCLAAYATWRTSDVALEERCAALTFAVSNLVKLCNSSPSLPRLSSLARAAWDAGQRRTSTDALRSLIGAYRSGNQQIKEPFWPVLPRLDAVSPSGDMTSWLRCAMGEQWERAKAQSSYFLVSAMDMDQLCANPFASTEMERRRILEIAIRGKVVSVPARLCASAADHVNADLWRAGLVPNTRVEAC